jgi:hypothetical protein
MMLRRSVMLRRGLMWKGLMWKGLRWEGLLERLRGRVHTPLRLVGL